MKENSEEISIELSKKKIFLFLLGSIAFVILSVLFIYNPQEFVNPIISSKELVFIIGILGCLVFGFFAVLLALKLKDKKAGMIISKQGIYDNSSAYSIGLIEWNDIVGISKSQVMSSKFIMIYLQNPEKYIQKAKNILAKKGMEANLKWYGSPFGISSNALKINFDHLEKLLIENLEKYKNQ